MGSNLMEARCSCNPWAAPLNLRIYPLNVFSDMSVRSVESSLTTWPVAPSSYAYLRVGLARLVQDYQWATCLNRINEE